MIRDLSETLKAMLDDASLPEPLRSAAIAFERPTDPYSPGQRTVNVFLYDIRENVELRSNEPRLERQNGQIIMHRPPLRVACSYLVTAWPVSGEELPLQEHELLSQVLQVLSGYPTIPEEFLHGRLKTQEPSLPMVTALVDPQKNLSDFWTAIGNKLRPSLTVTVTISMPVLADITELLVTTKSIGFDVGIGVVEETLVQIGGHVRTATGQGIASALVDLVGAGLRTTTNAEGQYTFVHVPIGTHTLRVIAGGFAPQTQSLIVPGRPEDYDVALTPL